VLQISNGYYKQTKLSFSNKLMKKTIIILFFIHYLHGDTKVTALNDVHHFFGGGTNNRIITNTTQLPEDNNDYQQILMHIYLSCPTDGCDPWDRKANISVEYLNSWYEIGRYITPYDVECDWTLDVTDYRSILKGEINLRSLY
tara:strand:- start:6370 stop:6798 length:429 start_codon:yes stop_codon:yes gene_type:complete